MVSNIKFRQEIKRLKVSALGAIQVIQHAQNTAAELVTGRKNAHQPYTTQRKLVMLLTVHVPKLVCHKS